MRCCYSAVAAVAVAAVVVVVIYVVVGSGILIKHGVSFWL